jgi:hypothetical protein
MPEYKIEGSLCFMTCGFGLEPYFEVYDIYPDGRIRYIINQRPKWIEEDKEAEEE